jgi:outer membrane protein
MRSLLFVAVTFATSAALAEPIPTLTAERVRSLAVQSSARLKVERAKVDEAHARTQESWTGYLPRLHVNARYVRLSDFDPPTIGGGGSLVGTRDTPGTVNPTSVALAPVSFPNILNQYTLQAQIVIPLSDYVLRIHEGYKAQRYLEEARGFEAKAAAQMVKAEAEVAFYNWFRAKGAVEVAQKALADQEAHLVDAKSLELAAMVPHSDVLRVQAELAGTRQALTHAESLLTMSEADLRVRLGFSPDAALTSSESINEAIGAHQGTVQELVARSYTQRAELLALGPSQDALHASARSARALQLPQVSAFADATMANPNARSVPQSQTWLGTWALGAQLTWSPTDALTSVRRGQAEDARAAQVEAQRRQLKEGILLEVTRAVTDMREAEAANGNAAVQVQAAEEAYRSIRDAYRSGKATATSVLDAEFALSRARLGVLSAHVDAHIARARMRLAVGED